MQYSLRSAMTKYLDSRAPLPLGTGKAISIGSDKNVMQQVTRSQLGGSHLHQQVLLVKLPHLLAILEAATREICLFNSTSSITLKR